MGAGGGGGGSGGDEGGGGRGRGRGSNLHILEVLYLSPGKPRQLQAKVPSDPRSNATVLWHEHLVGIVHAINTRILRVHGYTPSQLFMGFNARMTAFDEPVADEAMRSILAHHVANGASSVEQCQYDLRVAQIAEMRGINLGKSSTTSG